jgi:hypothetical protein
MLIGKLAKYDGRKPNDEARKESNWTYPSATGKFKIGQKTMKVSHVDD